LEEKPTTEPATEPADQPPVQTEVKAGVISPLLANLYLHWFEKAFHRPDGPACWANAKLVRYADDFVILARYQSRRLIEWVESLLEGRFRLTINRQKTRVVDLKIRGPTSLPALAPSEPASLPLVGRRAAYRPSASLGLAVSVTVLARVPCACLLRLQVFG
jgi:hypothetical protein